MPKLLPDNERRQHVGFTLRPADAEELRAAAVAEDRPLAHVAERAVRQYLAARKIEGRS